LRLDDAVERWLPELADRQVLNRLDGPLDQTVPAARPITVRDLLTFRLGFGQIMALPDDYPILTAASDLQIGMGPPNPEATPAPDEWLRRLGSLPLMHQPGEQWMYNTGSDLLGVLIARVAGQPLATFFRERIFAPLGMRDTGFSVPAANLGRLATAYTTAYDIGKLTVTDEAEGGQWSRPPAFPSGAAGLVSTVDDYLAFAQMLLNGGKYRDERILSRLAIEAMTTDQLTPAQRASAADFLGDNNGWGFGVSVILRRDDLVAVPGRYGWDGGLGTSWSNDPQEEMITILLTQRGMASPLDINLSLDFRTSAYQAIDD
jgi:CubicO group peptidase (beta-lactamase class C family)